MESEKYNNRERLYTVASPTPVFQQHWFYIVHLFIHPTSYTLLQTAHGIVNLDWKVAKLSAVKADDPSSIPGLSPHGD